jgi:hypothetical protein
MYASIFFPRKKIAISIPMKNGNHILQVLKTHLQKKYFNKPIPNRYPLDHQKITLQPPALY